MDTDIRKYIINNFKDDDTCSIKTSIIEGINSKEDEILVGFGVLFELLWKELDNQKQEEILKILEKSIKNSQ